MQYETQYSHTANLEYNGTRHAASLNFSVSKLKEILNKLKQFMLIMFLLNNVRPVIGSIIKDVTPLSVNS